MKATMYGVLVGVSLVSLLAGQATAASKHHKLCVPQGSKLSAACQSYGYVNGAPAHFKADRRSSHRPEASRHVTRR
jgi:hypothetical protein